MAELTSVYFLSENDELIRAIVEVRNLSFFERFGARRTPEEARQRDELPDQQETEEASDNQDIEGDGEPIATQHPDKGSGRPGSLHFHTLCILEMQTADDISDYLQSVTGQALDARVKKVDKAQRLAVSTIKKWLTDNDSKNT